MEGYTVTESELKTIGTLGRISAICFTIATSLLVLIADKASSLYLLPPGTPNETLYPVYRVMISLGIIAVVFLGIGILAFRGKGSTIDAIKKQSRRIPRE
jgi:hypothetical protein